MQYGKDTQDIRSIVRNYTIMPGLVLATIGGYGVFNGTFSMLWDKWLFWVVFGSNPDSGLANLGAFGSFILPFILYLVILYAVIRYYKRNFGQVRIRVEEFSKLAIELIAAFIVYFIIGGWLDIHLHPAVSITLLTFALFLLTHWWMFARAQRHYMLLAVIAVALSFIPLFNSTVYYWLYIKDTALDWYSFNISICCGLLLFIAGFLDHWHMVRTLARVRRQVSANSSLVPEATSVRARTEEL